MIVSNWSLEKLSLQLQVLQTGLYAYYYFECNVHYLEWIGQVVYFV